MRVLQLHTQYRQPGGEDVVVRAERAALRLAGHVVRHHTEENPGTSLHAAVSLAGSVWNPASAHRVRHIVEEFRPDVAHIHNTWFALSPSVLLTLRRRRVPIVMTVHNYRLACANALLLRDGVPCEKCLGHGPLPAIRHGCYRGSRVLSTIAAAGISIHQGLGTWARLVDRFIVLSEFARGHLTRAGLPEDRLLLGANFVDDPGPRHATPSSSREIIFIGRVAEEKGLHVLLDAWRSARPNGLELTVIGDGAARAQLQYEAPADVKFLGQRPAAQVMSRLLRARALIIPSLWYEGQPIVALEGLAAGTPLVVSGIGGLPEILGRRNAGWVTSPGAAGQLSGILRDLLDDNAVDDRGLQARLRYEETFTRSAAVPRLESAYEAALTWGSS